MVPANWLLFSVCSTTDLYQLKQASANILKSDFLINFSYVPIEYTPQFQQEKINLILQLLSFSCNVMSSNVYIKKITNCNYVAPKASYTQRARNEAAIYIWVYLIYLILFYSLGLTLLVKSRLPTQGYNQVAKQALKSR